MAGATVCLTLDQSEFLVFVTLDRSESLRISDFIFDVYDCKPIRISDVCDCKPIRISDVCGCRVVPRDALGSLDV